MPRDCEAVGPGQGAEGGQAGRGLILESPALTLDLPH